MCPVNSEIAIVIHRTIWQITSAIIKCYGANLVNKYVQFNCRLHVLLTAV